ncbi:hypothetical protein ACWENA_30005 [Streptomyces sp. NPDC004779]
MTALLARIKRLARSPQGRGAAASLRRAAASRHDERGYVSPETAPGAALTLRLRS